MAKFLIKPEQKVEVKKLKLSGADEGAKAKDEEGKFGKQEAKKQEADPSRPGTPVVDKTKRAHKIHVVLDNLSVHKTKAVEEFLEKHPKVRFHFTQTYSSWLNQVEIWFGKLQRDVIARGCLHFSRRLGPEAPKVCSRILQIGETLSVDLHRPKPPNSA